MTTKKESNYRDAVCCFICIHHKSSFMRDSLCELFDSKNDEDLIDEISVCNNFKPYSLKKAQGGGETMKCPNCGKELTQIKGMVKVAVQISDDEKQQPSERDGE